MHSLDICLCFRLCSFFIVRKLRVFAKSFCPSSGAAGTGAPFKFIQFTSQPSQDPSLPSEGLECNVSLFYLLDSEDPCDEVTILSFCSSPQGFVLFFSWSSTLRNWLSGKIFQKWNIPKRCHLSIWNLFCYFRSFFLSRFLPRQLLRVERIHFPNLRASMNIYLRIPSMDIYSPIHPWSQAWIFTHKCIQKNSSKKSIFSPSLVSTNFSSNVNWKFYRKFCLQICFYCNNLSNFTFTFAENY